MESNEFSIVSSIHCQDDELLLGTEAPSSVQIHLARLQDWKGKETEGDFCPWVLATNITGGKRQERERDLRGY